MNNHTEINSLENINFFPFAKIILKSLNPEKVCFVSVYLVGVQHTLHKDS